MRRLPAVSPRPRLATACALLAVLAVAAGGVLVYARVELLDPDRFARRAADAVQRPDVRDAVAARVVTEAIDVEPDLLTARPVLEAAVREVITTPAFRALVRTAAREAHRVLFAREAPAVLVDIADAARLVVPAVRSVDPELAADLPRRLQAPLATLDRRAFATDTIVLADRLRAFAVVLPLLALALLAGAVVLSADRRRALRRVPLVLAAAAALVLALLLAAEPGAERGARGLSLADAEEAVDDVWLALVGDLRTIAIAAGLGALAVALLQSPRARAVTGPATAGVRALLAPPRTRPALLARGAGLLAVGLLLVLARPDVVRLLGIVVAVALVARGAADLLGAASGALRAAPLRPRVVRVPAPADDDDLELGRIARFAAPALAAAAAVALLVLPGEDGDGRDPRRTAAVRACNGMAELCDRRLNEVVFPGTHNSMSAGDDPGWLFANQRRPLVQQLDDGIRLLLLDAHWGARAANGRVRTDLRAEGTDRNRIARAIGREAIGTAERLAGRLGAGDLAGRRGVWLCHSLCELGASPMAGALGEVRRWLDDHPGELLVVFVEPSVPAWAVQRELRLAGLERRVAALDRDRPLPTLRELLRRGRQLVVLAERDSGGAAWYHDGFSFVQDTPLGPASASSCRPSRGDPASPLFMINHWVDRFPPPPSANARINDRRTIVARAERCARERGVRPSLIAVDHYDLGDVVGAAAELNRRDPGTAAARP